MFDFVIYFEPYTNLFNFFGARLLMRLGTRLLICVILCIDLFNFVDIGL